MSTRIAVFPGSFNPFTIGHKAVVEKALPLFDTIIIAVGKNSAKRDDEESVERRMKAIAAAFDGNPHVEVASYSTLTIDFCKQHGAQFIIRGLRNPADFQYEQPIAQTNAELARIETVFFATPPELSHISSSIIRELASYGEDVSRYLP